MIRKEVIDLSSYINFYKKDCKTQRYIYLCSYSRSNVEYEYGEDYIPYGGIRLLTQEVIDNIMADIREENSHYEQSIREYNERKELIVKMDNPVTEKLEAIHEIDNDIRETKEIHDELTKAYWFYRTLRVIAADNYDYKNNVDDVIYAGIDNESLDTDEQEDE